MRLPSHIATWLLWVCDSALRRLHTFPQSPTWLHNSLHFDKPLSTQCLFTLVVPNDPFPERIAKIGNDRIATRRRRLLPFYCKARLRKSHRMDGSKRTWLWQIMACVATWSFGLEAVEIAAKHVEEGKSCIDAIESAINGTSCTKIIVVLR